MLHVVNNSTEWLTEFPKIDVMLYYLAPSRCLTPRRTMENKKDNIIAPNFFLNVTITLVFLYVGCSFPGLVIIPWYKKNYGAVTCNSLSSKQVKKLEQRVSLRTRQDKLGTMQNTHVNTETETAFSPHQWGDDLATRSYGNVWKLNTWFLNQQLT